MYVRIRALSRRKIWREDVRAERLETLIRSLGNIQLTLDLRC